MNWRVKGVIQRVLGYVPAGDRIHSMLRRRAGVLADFNRECDIKVDDWRLMMGHLSSSRVSVSGATLMEMGTGWYPTFPFCLYLAGATRVITLDLTRHLQPSLVIRLAERLASHVPLIARAAMLEPAEVAAKQQALAGALLRGAALADATDGVVIYRAPADASATGLRAESIDVVFSNSVLEHVIPDAIEACFAEAMRVLKPGGVAFHSVNCGDHYAYIDRSIDQLHYLRYSDAAWTKWNNAFLYQNRLRSSDFTAMARRAGFAIEIDTSTARPERLARLDAMPIAPQFAHYSREQLAITSIDFVARKLDPRA